MTKETVQNYFKAIHGGEWQSFIADDFVFVNSNLDKVVKGKAGYLEAAGRFFRATTSVEVKQLIIEGENACAIARYQLRSPTGRIGVCDVAEILSVKDDRLASSVIFFDTKAFADFMAQP